MARIDFFSSRFHYTFAAHRPTLTIKPGDSMRVICPDSDNMLSDGTLLPESRRQRDASVALEGNPMAGPIAIEGAEPGDCVSVLLDEIELDRGWGQTGLAPAHGVLPQGMLGSTAPPKHLYRWTIDRAAGVARVENPLGERPISVPMNPIVGCIGVCPGSGASVPTLYSGAFGGNMDLPMLRAGATVLLPVFHPDGLLMMGDIHAAQGHGEIIGGAIETSGVIACTIDLLKRQAPPAPIVIDNTHISAVGLDADLRQAVERAYANLLDWVVTGTGLNRWDAYNLISQTGEVVVGNLLAPPYPVAARLPRAVLPPTGAAK
jgi:amidase